MSFLSSGLGGFFRNAFGSPAAGTLWNLAGNYFSNQDFNRWSEQERENDRRFGTTISGLNRIGANDVGHIADGITRESNAAFSPTSIGDRWKTAFGGLSGAYEAVPNKLNTAQQRALRTYGGTTAGILGDVRNLGTELRTGFDANANRARRIVNSISDQDSVDAARAATTLEGSQRAELASRGLGGAGSVAASLANRVQRDAGDEQRRISDQRARELLSAEETFGSEGLRAMERSRTLGATLGGEFAGTTLQGGINAAGNLAQTQLGAITGRADLAGRRFDAQTQADITRINNMVSTGQMTIDAARRRVDDLITIHGQRIVSPPSGFQSATIQR